MRNVTSICTRQAIAIRELEWKRQWIETFLLSGASLDEAEQAFQVCYGNQPINIYRDPIDDAKGISGMISL
ncbi:hypothetical protein D3C72_66630 [compost metagenome]